MNTQVTLVLASFNTRELTALAIKSFRDRYPSVPAVLIDNGSGDGSAEMLRDMEGAATQVILNKINTGHGLALHEGIMRAETPFVLTLDSDCEVYQEGMLEAMLYRFRVSKELYALGWLRVVDRASGVARDDRDKSPLTAQFCYYVHPYCALWHRETYQVLPPFAYHGAPAIYNMLEVERRQLRLESFPTTLFVHHHVGGTRRRYGGRWDPSASEPPGPWVASETPPI